MQRTCATQLGEFSEGIIPVEVATHNFQIKVHTTGGNYITWSVHCCQFPMTPAYDFTNYQSQGQTLPYVIIDIATPPTGGLDLFNLYVALSRSSGRETIQLRLLHDFDDDFALLVEDDRLEQRDKITKAWWQWMGQECRMCMKYNTWTLNLASVTGT